MLRLCLGRPTSIRLFGPPDALGDRSACAAECSHG